jgi:hypothetical protein
MRKHGLLKFTALAFSISLAVACGDNEREIENANYEYENQQETPMTETVPDQMTTPPVTDTGIIDTTVPVMP